MSAISPMYFYKLIFRVVDRQHRQKPAVQPPRAFLVTENMAKHIAGRKSYRIKEMIKREEAVGLRWQMLPMDSLRAIIAPVAHGN
ncbi:hypothetical protein [Bifidobacterium catenulatum]|nr:hypothetical protein [Bifidobacterium catenulatum]